MGRPTIPKKQRRSVKITFRATAGLRRDLEKQAEQEQKTLGTYIADILQNVINKERGE